MVKHVKVYGERNTNTNYMSRLIELNLKATELPGIAPRYIMALQRILPGNETVRDIYFQLTFSNNLGWKHSKVLANPSSLMSLQEDSDVNFLTITKNPYAWLLSLHRRPYHQYYREKPSFNEFLCRPWKTVARDNLGSKTLPNPMELWNQKNRSYLLLPRDTTLNITSEQIIESPSKVIKAISERFSIPVKSSTFVDFNQSTKDSTKDSAYYQDYYLNERWKNELTPESISIINKSLDSSLLAEFGYQMLSV